jgi:hypothetical protein
MKYEPQNEHGKRSQQIMRKVWAKRKATGWQNKVDRALLIQAAALSVPQELWEILCTPQVEKSRALR